MTRTLFACRRPWQVFALSAAIAVFWLGGESPSLAAPSASPALLDTSVAAPGSLDADPCASAAAQIGGGGANNMVLLHNQVNGGLTARGNVQVNQIPGPSVSPVNCAYATSTCLDCRTLAVALQINLISRTATFIAPRNVARAQNIGCQGCKTAALALQYVRQVDDPTSMSPEFASLVQRMNDELRVLQTDPGLTLDQALAQVDGVLAQFQDLATSLDDQRSQALQ
jgi:hypothetical protein